MVVPMLFIVVLNTGLVLPLLILVLLGSALLLFKLLTRKPKYWRPFSLLVACFLLLVIPVHYGLAFKFVTVVGLLIMPFAGWKMGR